MEKIIEFRIPFPTIELAHWMPTEDEALEFPFEEDGIVGTVFLNLDQTAVEYELLGGSYDSDTGEADVEAEPGWCYQIVVRVAGNSDNDDAITKRFLGVAHKLATRYTIRFANFIKFVLGQYWVDMGLMSEWSIARFFHEVDHKWITTDTEQIGLLMPNRHDYYSLQTINENTNPLEDFQWKDIQNILVQENFLDQIVSTSEKLLIEAKKHLSTGEYNLAVIEAISALEMELEPFIIHRCKKGGISKTRFDDSIGNKLFISGYLKVLLPLVLSEEEYAGFKLTIEQCIKLNRKRNKIVHEGHSIPLEEAEQGIQAIEKLMGFVRSSQVRERNPK